MFFCVFLKLRKDAERKRLLCPNVSTLLSMIVAISDFLGPREKVSCLDTTTGEFEYKLLNRCLVTNSFLFSKICIIPSPACPFCGNMSESLENFLFLLTIVRISGLRL